VLVRGGVGALQKGLGQRDAGGVEGPQDPEPEPFYDNVPAWEPEADDDDLDGDGVVGSGDVAMILLEFGWTCQ
jgi:hypothetical protein